MIGLRLAYAPKGAQRFLTRSEVRAAMKYHTFGRGHSDSIVVNDGIPVTDTIMY